MLPPDVTPGSEHPHEQNDSGQKEKKSGFAKPKKFNSITIMFIDFVNFNHTNKKPDAGQLVKEIKFYYSTFDEIITKHGLEKIRSDDDSYMCAGGLFVASKDHAVSVLKAALEIQQFIAVSNIERTKYDLPVFECRIVIHSGTVVADIADSKKIVYDISGDTINIASEKEPGCQSKKINLSGSTYVLIKDEYNCTYRGKIAAKNKELIDMYFLDEEIKLSVYSPAGAENFIKGKLKRKLPPQLTYHGFHHTEDVLNAVLQIATAENISKEDIQLLRIAALFHDSGFTEMYKDHEEKGCAIAKEYLPFFGFPEKDIDCICGMIMATKIPQRPHTKLQEILCDADLDYLGRDDFYTIGRTLFEEFMTYSIVKSEQQWNEIQVKFLSSHHYFTSYSKMEREPQKQLYLSALKKECSL